MFNGCFSVGDDRVMDMDGGDDCATVLRLFYHILNRVIAVLPWGRGTEYGKSYNSR